MSRNIKAKNGRWIIMLSVLGTFVVSLLSLYFVARDGAISGGNALKVIKNLLEIYLPLLSIMAAFYFSGMGSESKQETSIEPFVFSIIVVGLWVLCPPLFIIFGIPIEAAMRTLNILKAYGETIAAGGVAYYFAKSA